MGRCGLCPRSGRVDVEVTPVSSDVTARGVHDVRARCVCSHDGSSRGAVTIGVYIHICLVWYGWQVVDVMATIIVSLLFVLEVVVSLSEVSQIWPLGHQALGCLRESSPYSPAHQCSAGDLAHQGSGVARYERSARKGSSAFLRRCLIVCTALSACPLLAG